MSAPKGYKKVVKRRFVQDPADLVAPEEIPDGMKMVRTKKKERTPSPPPSPPTPVEPERPPSPPPPPPPPPPVAAPAPEPPKEEPKKKKEKLDPIVALFNTVDVDQSGSITADELQECLDKLGQKFPMDKCKRLLDKFDVDGDECITIDEFRKLCKFITETPQEDLKNFFKAPPKEKHVGPVDYPGGIPCCVCGKGIDPEDSLDAIGKPWHPECFKCDLCGEVVEEEIFVLNQKKGVPVHHTCAKLADVKCSKCGEDIVGKMKATVDNTVKFHVECWDAMTPDEQAQHGDLVETGGDDGV